MAATSARIETVLSALREALPAPDLLIHEVADLAPYGRDWSGDHEALPLAVARPRDAATVAALLRRCAELRLPVVPQGGLTGLVGGAVAQAGRRELVISFERMAAVRSVSALDYAIVVEAGCVLETAKRAAEEADCLLPITFGSQGSCRLGGNVATNAGGFNVLRYGMTRDLVLGLEVALPDGRIWNGLRILRKDNRGLDLKQLFIGSEGTLGVVTAAAFKLFPRPTKIETALVGLRSPADAMALYARARRSCSDLLSAFELLLRPCIDVTLASRPDYREPLDGVWPAYVLMELSASGAVDLRQVLESCIEEAGDLVADGVLAESRAQSARLWSYREIMVETQGRGRPYLRTDVSVSVSMIEAFLDGAQAALSARFPKAEVLSYGHVGDGNIHMNVIPPADMGPEERPALFHAAEETIFEVLDRLGGSISAEHGIGRAKRASYLKRVDPVTLDLQKGIKSLLDPQGLLSAGRILPASGDA